MSGLELLYAASAGLGAVGAVGSGLSANRIAQSQAAYMEADAEVARELGAVEADLVRRDGARAVGEAVALQGASGFAMDGSAMDVIAELAGEYDYKARVARYEAGRTARRLENEAASTHEQGRASRTAGFFQAGGSLLTGAANIEMTRAATGRPSLLGGG
jgi:hypothetical protein